MPSAGTLCAGGRLKRRVRAALPRGGRRRRRPGGRLTDGVGQREQVIRARLRRLRGHRQAQDFPAPRHSQGAGMLFAEVIAMRLGVSGQWPEDRSGISVDVRQSCHRGLAAG